MVADKEKVKNDMIGLINVVTWSMRLEMWLMRKTRNHLGLENRPERPENNEAAAVRLEYKKGLAAWLEKKDTCVSAAYEYLKHWRSWISISWRRRF